jgi:subtilisin family serine protease
MIAAGLAAAAPALAQEVGVQVLEALRRGPRARVVVALREPETPATSPEARAGEVESLQAGVLAALQPAEFRLTGRWTQVSALAGDLTADGLSALLVHSDVLRIDLDVPARAAMAESVQLIRADQAQNRGFTGRGITVAVLDSGVDTGHPDLKDGLVAEQCFCANGDGSGCCPGGGAQASGAGAAKDENGHGTNVTGIIAGKGRVAPEGVAPEASHVQIRVLDRNGAAASITQIISGLDWLLQNRPDVKVVNLSLETATLFSGTCDTAASYTMSMAQAVSGLRARGAVVFASSGNNASSTQLGAPACLSGVVAVGAVYKGNVGSVSFGCSDPVTAADKIACFSNSNSKVDLLAPGAVIVSSGLSGGQSSYVGTSQACPMAAGAAALLLQAKPGLGPDQLRDLLKNSGVAVTDPRNGLGFRRIDVQAALQAAGS